MAPKTTFTSPASIDGSKLVTQEAFESLASFLESRGVVICGGKPHDCPGESYYRAEHTTDGLPKIASTRRRIWRVENLGLEIGSRLTNTDYQSGLLEFLSRWVFGRWLQEGFDRSTENLVRYSQREA